MQTARATAATNHHRAAAKVCGFRSPALHSCLIAASAWLAWGKLGGRLLGLRTVQPRVRCRACSAPPTSTFVAAHAPWTVASRRTYPPTAPPLIAPRPTSASCGGLAMETAPTPARNPCCHSPSTVIRGSEPGRGAFPPRGRGFAPASDAATPARPPARRALRGENTLPPPGHGLAAHNRMGMGDTKRVVIMKGGGGPCACSLPRKRQPSASSSPIALFPSTSAWPAHTHVWSAKTSQHRCQLETLPAPSA